VLLRGRVAGCDGNDGDLAERQLDAVFGPADGGVIGGIAGIGELDDDAEPDRTGLQARFEFVEEEVGGLGGGSLVGEVVVACDGKDAIAAKAAGTG
jgi:hypothetical protein